MPSTRPHERSSTRTNIYNSAASATTVRTEIIGHQARTLELPLVVKSVSQVRAESESSRGVFPPNPEGGILDVLAPCPIISVLTVATTFYLNPLPYFNSDTELSYKTPKLPIVETYLYALFFPPKFVLFPDPASLECGMEVRHLCSVTVFRPLLRPLRQFGISIETC